MEFKHYLHNSYRNPVCRSWHSSASLKDTNLIYPIFVTNNEGQKTEISSMPGNYRYGWNVVVEELRPLIVRPGPHLRAVMVFGVMEDHEKNLDGSSYKNSPVAKVLPLLKKEFPELLLCVDVCLCAYTTHGHCGVLEEDGSINLKGSQDQLSDMSLFLATNKADVICPSDMMDSRIYYIKKKLIENSFYLPILSYSTKYQSGFYGPFRDAAHSAPAFGDRGAYQLPPSARELGIRAAIRDVEEGADFVMVKPGMPYLDLIRDLKNTVSVPIACYQVSGEFAMIYHAAQAGGLELKRAVLETMTGFLRAGSTIIITYFTPQLLDWLNE
jgi:porphobilinogen synthase